MSDKIDFVGVGNCQCCGKKDVWCGTLRKWFQVDGIEIICEKCDRKIPDSAKPKFGKKEDWQITRAKASLLDIKASAEKKLLDDKLKIDKVGFVKGFLNFFKGC